MLPDFTGLTCDQLQAIIVADPQYQFTLVSKWFMQVRSLSDLDEVQLRIVAIALRDSISFKDASLKLIRNLEAKLQEWEPGWKFDPRAIDFK